MNQVVFVQILSIINNQWPALWNYGKIKHHLAEGNCHNDFMIPNDGRP